MSTSFDTLKLTKRLKEAGMPQDQAVKTAEVFADMMNNAPSTKSDLQELVSLLLGEVRLVKWMLFPIFTTVAVSPILINLF